MDSAGAGIRSSVLCPAMIYGHGLGPARNEAHIAALVAQARHSGVVRHVGAGRNIWSTVHVEDLADVCLPALEGSPAGTFYFVENGGESRRAGRLDRRGTRPRRPRALGHRGRRRLLGARLHRRGPGLQQVVSSPHEPATCSAGSPATGRSPSGSPRT
ncbi:NAD-dependent epimerase/dehydratase family protein [Streptomyces sp. NBC_01373]|uniref:NAD-dependent epimerase/dehydratase family protein n=1 Tax=Streptomyces sp. NBC_01373 TaxID=2903843 RepID=UPI00339027B9